MPSSGRHRRPEDAAASQDTRWRPYTVACRDAPGVLGTRRPQDAVCVLGRESAVRDVGRGGKGIAPAARRGRTAVLGKLGCPSPSLIGHRAFLDYLQHSPLACFLHKYECFQIRNT